MDNNNNNNNVNIQSINNQAIETNNMNSQSVNNQVTGTNNINNQSVNNQATGTNNINNQSVNNQATGTNNINNKRLSKGETIFLAIASINFTGLLPLGIHFWVIWLIFGGLNGDKANYYSVLFVCSLYILASLIVFIVAIWNVVKHRKVFKWVFLVISIIVVLLVTLFFGMFFINM